MDLVDVPAPQPASDPGHGRIVSRGLWYVFAVIERAHGAEFDDAALPLIEAVAALQKERGPWAVERDGDRNGQQQRREDDKADRRKDQVERPFFDDLQSRQRGPRQLQARHRTEL